MATKNHYRAIKKVFPLSPNVVVCIMRLIPKKKLMALSQSEFYFLPKTVDQEPYFLQQLMR